MDLKKKKTTFLFVFSYSKIREMRNSFEWKNPNLGIPLFVKKKQSLDNKYNNGWWNEEGEDEKWDDF